jgi:hypothetical protein
MEQAPVTRTCKKCGETKAFELFLKAPSCKFGRSHVCKKCYAEKSMLQYYRLYYKPQQPKIAPTTRNCTKCGETKALELFKSNKSCDFGKERVCKKCDQERVKKYFAENFERRKEIANRSYLKYKYDPVTKRRAADNAKRFRDANPIKIKLQSKKYYHNSVTNISNRYVKNTIYNRFGIRSSNVTDEQVELQRESIQLHREFKQLKQQLQ